ncbi:TolC family protein [Brevundimonas sp.]|uniref:TolC family protein n=1 Tax=unclassified Brevundimonas TaxID=2622653 RepID=UPI003AFFC2A8
MRPGARPAAILALCALAPLAGCAVYAPEALTTTLPADPTPATIGRFERDGQAIGVDLTAPLDPADLAALAVVLNPELRAQRARVGVTQAQVFEAGLLPDPQFSASLDRPQSAPGLVDALAASLGLDTSAFYIRPQALRGARAGERQARLDLAWLEWQTGNQASVLAARIQGLETALTFAREAEAISSSVLNRSLGAVARGDLSAVDIEARRLAEADAADRARTTERDLTAARLELNAILGLSPQVQISLAPLAPAPPCLPASEALVARALSDRLDLAALRAGYEAQEAALHVAVLQQYPRLNLSLNAARDTGAVRTNGVAVGFDLPLWNRNRGQIAIQEATREQLRVEYEARLFATRADLATLSSALEIGRRQRSDLLAQVGPLRTTVEAFERAGTRGDIAQVIAETARLSLLDKEIALAALDQAMAEQWRALQMAAGRELEADACAA